jgi:hypothetical protein
MSQYDFIIDNLKFSYSSLSSFDTCQYMWFLTYIKHEERLSGWFAEYGSFCHHIMEEFFAGKLEAWDLGTYYAENYNKYIISSPPPFPASMPQSYYDTGLEFFENFEFNRENYEIISIEDSIFTKYKNINLIIKPDLILKNKKDGNIVLLDYKTYKLKDTKKDNEKLSGYTKQLLIYAYFIWLEQKLEINKIFLWFIRNSRFVEIEMNPVEIQASLDWIENTVEKIKSETAWKPNLDKSNEYFCSQLCSVRNDCGYRNGEGLEWT